MVLVLLIADKSTWCSNFFFWLQDVLENDALKLDAMFKNSLITDLYKVTLN